MRLDKKTFDKLKKLGSTILENGAELNDPTPMVMDANLERPPTLREQIQRVIKSDLAIQAQYQGYESFEEANDFEIGEEDEIGTQYEIMPDENIVAPTQEDLAPEEPDPVPKEAVPAEEPEGETA